MKTRTAALAATEPGTRPASPSTTQDSAQSADITMNTRVRRLPLMRPRTKNCRPTMTAVLTAKAKPMTRVETSATLAGERRHAGLHLAVADERGRRRSGGSATARTAGAGSRGRSRVRHWRAPARSARPWTCRSGPSSRAIGTSMEAASARKIAVKVAGRSTSTNDAADHAAEADAEVDQREVDAEVLLAGRARDHRGDQGVEGRPRDAEVEADEEERQGHRSRGRGEREDDAPHRLRRRGEQQHRPARRPGR